MTILIFSANIYAASFIKNSGDFADSVLFSARTNNAHYFICNHSIVTNYFELQVENENRRIEGFAGELTFLNSNGLNQKIEGITKKDFYYLASSNELYSEIIFYNVYNKIDLRLYFQDNHLRFDFILNPESNYNDILLHASDLMEKKSLKKIQSRFWGLSELYSYQKDKEIKSNFKIDGNLISFKLENFNTNDVAVIDPILYSTYLGGLDIDSGEDLVIDDDESIIVVGETASLNFPVTLGAYQRELNQGTNVKSDVFITKVDINYNHIFTTYFGSSSDDFGRAVDLDDEGNIYVTGYTASSTDFPLTTNAYSSTYNGFYDGFIIKVSSDGRDLLASTLFGGDRDDFPLSIKLLPDKSIVVIGYTGESDGDMPFPTTGNAFNEFYLGNIDGFVTRFNNDLSEIIWSGLLGGLQDDFPQDLTIGKDSTIYITGLTRSPNFPTTDGVLFREYQDNNNSPQHSDAFFTRISYDGQEIIMSSLYGGNNGDIAYGIKLDSEANIYITGETRSSNLPTSNNAPLREINGGNEFVFASDAYIAKFNQDASDLIYATYLGGESTERAFDLDLDAFQNAYLVGTTSSPNFPITEFAYDKVLNDSVKYSDIFITKINPDGDSIVYSSFFGAEKSDLAKAVQLRSENRLVITGNTSSTFLETTDDAVQVAYQDSLKADAHFFEFLIDEFVDADYIICIGNSTTLDSDIRSSSTQTLSFEWSPKEFLNDPTLEFPTATPDKSTLFTCIATDEFGDRYVAQKLVATIAGFKTSINGDIEVEDGLQYLYTTEFFPNTVYNWTVANGFIESGQGTNSVIIRWSNSEFGSLRLIALNEFGCSDTVSIFTRLKESFPWDIYPFGDYRFCEGDTVLLDAGPQFKDIIWQDGWGGRYDTVYKSGEYFFSGMRQDGSVYQSPISNIEFLEKPRKPTIIQSEVTGELVCISFANNYYWFLEEVLISGQNTRFLLPFANGCYSVSIENLDECTNLSDEFCIKNLSVENIESQILIYPNPANDLIILEFPLGYSAKKINILNSLGEKIIERDYLKERKIEINLRNNSTGLYFIMIDGILIDKMIIL